MSNKKIIYQSREYEFPKRAWFFAAWLETGKGNYFPVFSSRVENSESGVLEYAREFVDLFKELNIKGEVLNEVLLVSLGLSDKYPLKEKYWKDPSYEIDEFDKVALFSRALRYKNFYQFIITPSYKLPGSDKIALSPAFAVLKGNVEDVEVFMEVSNHPVFKDAKNAAIYDVVDRFGYDLGEDKVIKDKEEIFFN